MLAIIGSTASGKSALAFYLASKYKLDIFSIDSLSIYKYIDIASAKPSKAELSQIKHYGIDVLNPDEKCNAKLFFDLLNSLSQKRLIIVGGSSFYLKSIIDGLSKIPQQNKEISKYVESLNKYEAYQLLTKIDETYTSKIHKNDTYRIAKGLEIYLLTGKSPSVFFMENKKEKLNIEIKIFELIKPKEILIKDIESRTKAMYENGLIDEVQNLISSYPSSQTLKAIGIKEIISFLDSKITKEQSKELIIKNTIQLAKRQRTFNRTQFCDIFRGDFVEVKKAIEESLDKNI
ncbi:tRNA (adenosine(37)-N6)-dimethylallyltransferase MiaA [Helicobacter sp. MIT 99-5507]|uniref:tRNA (adenosine(37)-N6)-dimethylallyltransferase MiaA n=1 Tax=Helicobacter sp. MIT 99-5507 TaxID=152489 RepID=UPI000E1EDA06|nr:tRNA (adenosine(37)-N6)-dimethylallyltransferase MiaA [Helicobacter sp. MIT 99-5507]RDU57966.1 tRNA (adenosine(37)-N6)-dimethylallyltransferase MiaA [Helicobacter sp. MIT 99-5507]